MADATVSSTTFVSQSPLLVNQLHALTCMHVHNHALRRTIEQCRKCDFQYPTSAWRAALPRKRPLCPGCPAAGRFYAKPL